MRRALLFLLILSLAIELFSTKKELSKPLILQAGYRSVHEFYVTPIASQSQNFMIGMPFNIEDPNVQYQGNVSSTFGSGSGRIIADFNMLFNTPVDIKIKATPLKPSTMPLVDDEDNISLTYSLAFDYTISYTNQNGEQRNNNGYIIYDGNNNISYLWDYDNKREYPADSEGYAPFSDYVSSLGSVTTTLVGNVDGKVIFGFTQESTNKISNQESFKAFPVGEYIAEVTILIKEVSE